MNDNIDLTKILKDCPIGTKLYSTIHGEVSLISCNISLCYPIVVRLSDNSEESFTAKGKLLMDYNNCECVLFPSKDQRDWSKFSVPWYKKEKFDPKTLKPFDKVLVRDDETCIWKADFYSHKGENRTHPFKCVSLIYKCCIPYNEDTKHLVGTKEEAPEYYRYWED